MKMSGRAATAFVVLAYLGVMATGYSVVRESFWQKALVDPADPYFLDLRVITSGWDCLRSGFDVLRANPCDPSGRPVNYTYPWRLASILGFGESDTLIVGLLFIALFLIGVWFLMGRTPLAGSPIWIVAICSPAVMLGVERGNPDLLIFAILSLYSILVVSNTPIRRGGAYVTIASAAILKLFPVFAMTSLWHVRPSRRTLLALAGLLVTFALLTHSDFLNIYRLTQKGRGLSYGSRVVIDAWGGTAGNPGLIDAFPGSRLFLGSSIALCVIAAGFLIGTRWRKEGALPNRPLVAFWVGASIYIGTFLLGNNWDYRLMFLLFTIPLLQHIRSQGGINRRGSSCLLFLLLFELWFSSRTWRGWMWIPEETITWILLLGLSAGLGATLHSSRTGSRLEFRRH